MLDLFQARNRSRSSDASGAPGLGVNLFVLPRDEAFAFLAFCYANYASGSVVGFSDAGDPLVPLGTSLLDVRDAAGCYDIVRGAGPIEQRSNLREVWRDNLVSIAIGCSLALDEILAAAGLATRHAALGLRVPVYATRLATRAVAPFSPRLHVSMRIVALSDVERLVAISRAYPALHGAPIHVGDPAALGIDDLTAPLLGDALAPGKGEVCAFWGCGVTLRAGLAAAAMPLWMANSEGHLARTDLTADDFRAVSA